MRRLKNVIILLSSFSQDEAHTNYSQKCNKSITEKDLSTNHARSNVATDVGAEAIDRNRYPSTIEATTFRERPLGASGAVVVTNFEGMAVLVRIRRFSSSVINACRSIPRSVDFERSFGDLRSSSVMRQLSVAQLLSPSTIPSRVSAYRRERDVYIAMCLVARVIS